MPCFTRAELNRVYNGRGYEAFSMGAWESGPPIQRLTRHVYIALPFWENLPTMRIPYAQ